VPSSSTSTPFADLPPSGMSSLHDRSCIGHSNHRFRRRDTSRAPCHHPAAARTRLWRNSSPYREEQSRSPAAQCDVRQAHRAPAKPASAALLPTKNRRESSTKTNRCSHPPSITSRVLTEPGKTMIIFGRLVGSIELRADTSSYYESVLSG
jgi:hypothetical protein